MCVSWFAPAGSQTGHLGAFHWSPVFQLCSPALAGSLNILKKLKKQRSGRRRDRWKVLRSVRERQSRGGRTRPGPDRGLSDVGRQPGFSGKEISESVAMNACFLCAPFRIRAVAEHRKRPMTWSRSSSAAPSSRNLCPVPRANWSSWWRTSTTAPPHKHLPPFAQHGPSPPTAASTVPGRCTATSRETPVSRLWRVPTRLLTERLSALG